MMATDSIVLEEPPKVLLVDDRQDNLLTLNAVLESLPIRLVNASSGREALRTLLHEEVAAIILDVQMPGMDGFETAQLARSRAATRDIPIVFLTAISRSPTHELRGYEVGAVDYICKPFDPDVLRAKVSALVRISTARGKPPESLGASRRWTQDRREDAAPVVPPARLSRVVDLVLPASVKAPALARSAARQALEGVPPEVAETAILLISELVANAVLHAHSGPHLYLDLGASVLRAEIADSSPGDVTIELSDSRSPSGRGLELLAKFAQRSGRTHHDDGKIVWFELALSS